MSKPLAGSENLSERAQDQKNQHIAAADLPEHVTHSVSPDSNWAAGQAVPNLRSLHRQLPAASWGPPAAGSHVADSGKHDTCIISMVQLGSAGLRQVSMLPRSFVTLRCPCCRTRLETLSSSSMRCMRRMRLSQQRCFGLLSLEVD